ncbi:MAG: hypothetical protein ACT4ON_05765 [Bacteroidota bacterium]
MPSLSVIVEKTWYWLNTITVIQGTREAAVRVIKTLFYGITN